MNLKRTLLVAAVCFIATISSATTNLIKNSDFEEVTLVGVDNDVPHPAQWTVNAPSGALWRASAKEDVGIDGSRALDFNESEAGQWMNIAQIITVKANTDYTVSYYGYYPAEPASGRSSRIEIQKADNAATKLKEAWVDKEAIYDPATNAGIGPDANNTTVQHSFEFNSGEHTEIKLVIYSNNLKARVFFDNFRMEEKTGTDITQTTATDAIRRMDNTLVLGAEITSSAVYNLAGANMNIAVRNSKMDISALPQGVYVVRSKTAEGTYVSHKFVK